MRHIQGLLFLLLVSFHNALTALNPTLFYQKLSEPTPEWMKEQIEHDLAPFQEQLSKRFLDELFYTLKEPWFFVRIRVSNNHLTVEQSETTKGWLSDNYIKAFKRLQQIISLPDLDLVITGHDSYDLERKANIAIQGNLAKITAMPIFCLAKRQNDLGMILLPDWYALTDFLAEKVVIRVGTKMFPWNAKKPVAFFRGADSGAFDRIKWRDCSRIKLVRLSFERPDLVDARLTSPWKYEEDSTIRDTMKREGMIGSSLPLGLFLQYRYIIDVDGHTANTPRVALWLHSNSTMFKQTSEDMLWFFGALKPYTHYVPLANDLSDLFSQVEWARNHDDECQKISKNGNRFAEEFLSPEGIYLYLFRLLEAYSQKQKEVYLK